MLSVRLESVRGRIHVELVCDGHKAGELNAYDVEPVTLLPECRASLRALGLRVGRKLTPYVVFRSRLRKDLRGSGVGSVMYVAATEAASQLDAALVQHSCFLDPHDLAGAGTTTDVARWVWEGARFGQHVLIEGGRIAYLPPEHWGRAAAMLRFGQIGYGAPKRNRTSNPHGGPVAFGEALQQALRGHEHLLGTGRLRNKGWRSGGCAVLAVALREWFPGFRFAGIAEGRLVHHVLVEYGGFYFDSDGASTAAELVHRWRTKGRRPHAQLVSLEGDGPPAAIRSTFCEIPIVRSSVDRTAAYLKARLGAPSTWGFVRANPSYRLSGADTQCDYRIVDGERTRVCVIDVDHSRPMDLVQVEQLLALEQWGAG